MREKCSTKFCCGVVALVFKGKPLCDKCWSDLCDNDEDVV